MSELRPVRPKSLIDRHLTELTTLLVVALVIAIGKPWSWFPGGGAGQPGESAEPSARETAGGPTTQPHIGFEDLAYDPSIFGIHEPPPVWGLWPATYLVTFGFVFQVPDVQSPTSSLASGPPPSAAASRAPSPVATAGPTRPPGQVGDGGPAWPDRFTSPAGYHLFLIGIDMPNGYALGSARLFRVVGDGTMERVDLLQLESPWPAHFAVLGIPGPEGTNRLRVWPPGTYRLTLTFDPDASVQRTIEIDVAAPPRS